MSFSPGGDLLWLEGRPTEQGRQVRSHGGTRRAVLWRRRAREGSVSAASLSGRYDRPNLILHIYQSTSLCPGLPLRLPPAGAGEAACRWRRPHRRHPSTRQRAKRAHARAGGYCTGACRWVLYRCMQVCTIQMRVGVYNADACRWVGGWAAAVGGWVGFRAQVLAFGLDASRALQASCGCLPSTLVTFRLLDIPPFPLPAVLSLVPRGRDRSMEAASTWRGQPRCTSATLGEGGAVSQEGGGGGGACGGAWQLPLARIQ